MGRGQAWTTKVPLDPHGMYGPSLGSKLAIWWDCLSQLQFKDTEVTKEQTLYPSSAPTHHSPLVLKPLRDLRGS